LSSSLLRLASSASAQTSLLARLRAYAWVAPGLIVAAGVFAAYVRTLEPGIDFHDWGEMQVHARLLGVPHNTGYPLYIWLGHLFGQLPFGTPAYRMNLFSAVCGATSVWLVTVLTTRLTSRSMWGTIGGAIAALAFGLSFNQWTISTFSEVYALHVSLALTVIWLAIRWQQEGHDSLLWAGALLAGATLGGHLIALSLLPPLGLFILVVRPGELTTRRIVGAGSLVLLGFAIGHLFLLWLLWRRHSPWDTWHTVALAHPDLFDPPGGRDGFWRCWWWNIAAYQFHFAFRAPDNWVGNQLRALPHRVLGELFFFGAAGACAGLLSLARRNWQAALLLSGVFLTLAAMVMHFSNGRPTYYFVAPYACLSVGLGVALAGLGERLERLSGGRASAVALFFALVAAAAYADFELALPYRDWLRRHDAKTERMIGTSLGPRPDLSHDHWADNTAHRLIPLIPDGSLVLADWRLLYPLEYVALVEGQRPALEFQEAYPAPKGWGFTEQRKAYLQGEMKRRGVFLVGSPDGARGPWDLTQVTQYLSQFH
jgi:hypothetical protein